MSSLSEKLKSLGVKVGTQDLSPPRPRYTYPIQQILPGGLLTTAHGEIFLVEKRYPLEHRHGSAVLNITASLQIMAEWARQPQVAELPPHAFAFLDTETTGLAGGTGTYVFLVGVARYNSDSFQLAQFFMRDPAEEPSLLAALEDFLHPCQALVTFNGKAFDVPLLNTRYITNGAAPPLVSVPHLDLLPLARRLWRDRLPSRALGYLEQHILGAHRTHEDVPGWLIPSVYFDYLRSGDARPLQGIFYHNAMDVLSLAALFGYAAKLLAEPLGAGIAHAVDQIAVGKLYEDLGYLQIAAQLYEQGLAQDLPEEVRWDAVQRLSLICKRCEDLTSAVTLWQEAAHSNQVYAHVELAKFYEHAARDYREAARWTEAALALISAPGFPRQESQRWLADLQHRLARLRRRLGLV